MKAIKVGDVVRFLVDFDKNDAPEVDNFVPPIQKGAIGMIVDIDPNNRFVTVEVRLHRGECPIRVNVYLPPVGVNSHTPDIACLRAEPRSDRGDLITSSLRGEHSSGGGSDGLTAYFDELTKAKKECILNTLGAFI